jgi:tetratricopeptide (TPR) repeat protein
MQDQLLEELQQRTDQFVHDGNRDALLSDDTHRLAEQLADAADEHPANEVEILQALGWRAWYACEATADPTYLDQAVDLFQRALALTAPNDPERPARLASLGNALRIRFHRTDNTADLDRAVKLYEEAVADTAPDHTDFPVLLSDLGTAWWIRFERSGDSADLDRAIDLFERAVEVTSHGDPCRPERLAKLGLALSTRFGRTGVDRLLG